MACLAEVYEGRPIERERESEADEKSVCDMKPAYFPYNLIDFCLNISPFSGLNVESLYFN